MATQNTASSSSLGVAFALGGLYLAFAAWLYITYPVVLGLFCGALAVIWLLEATKKFLRSPVLLRVRARQ